jgi:hypothetical protein
MTEWWTYRLEDFLLFSPRVYWRMFELHNEAVWPLQVPILLLGAAVLAWLIRPRPWSDQAVAAVLAAAWAWVAWSFLWNRYSLINWAASYAVAAFAIEAVLLVWIGVFRERLHFAAERSVRSVTGLTLFLYALVVHPLVPKLSGRSFRAAEIFGVAPDPTVIGTLGLLSMVSIGSAAWPLLPVPLAWCLLSWATLHTMAAPEAGIPLAVAGLAIASGLWTWAGRRTPLGP